MMINMNCNILIIHDFTSPTLSGLLQTWSPWLFLALCLYSSSQCSSMQGSMALTTKKWTWSPSSELWGRRSKRTWRWAPLRQWTYTPWCVTYWASSLIPMMATWMPQNTCWSLSQRVSLYQANDPKSVTPAPSLHSQSNLLSNAMYIECTNMQHNRNDKIDNVCHWHPCTQIKWHYMCITSRISDLRQDIKSNIFVGLAAVAGFLVVVFIAVVSFNAFKKEKNDRRYVCLHMYANQWELENVKNTCLHNLIYRNVCNVIREKSRNWLTTDTGSDMFHSPNG